MATPPKITLDDLLAYPSRADGLADEQVRDTLKQIAERTATLKALESQILWRLLTERNSNVRSDGFPRLLDAKQLAEHLSIPESWVREQARLGQLPSIKLGHYVRFRLDDIKEHLSTIEQRASTTTQFQQQNTKDMSAHQQGSQDPISRYRSIPWQLSEDTIKKTVPAELAAVATAWTTVLWAHMVHENGLISRLKNRLKNTSPKPS
jgi:excisionase family DNA binding protein